VKEGEEMYIGKASSLMCNANATQFNTIGTSKTKATSILQVGERELKNRTRAAIASRVRNMATLSVPSLKPPLYIFGEYSYCFLTFVSSLQ
jgi:hypothetical protein